LQRIVRHAAPLIQPNPEGWIDHRPSVTQQQVAHALFDAGSPLAGSWPRRDKYDYAEYIWNAGRALGIDPAVFLGFFHHESGYGLAGMATVTHSPGNLRCYNSSLPGSYCDNVNGGYEAYQTWFDGIDGMYALLWHYGHVLGLRHVDQVVPVWAPNSDGNNDSAYIQGVLDTMQQATAL
jgi:hypothetical protein